MSKPKVLISVPNQRWIHKQVVYTLIQLLQDKRMSPTLILPTWKPYEHNLARITKDMLDGGYDYWLNIDADNPPTKNPLDLVALDLDVVGCPTPIWHNTGDGTPYCWSAMDCVSGGWREHCDKQGLQKVDAIGSGCMLVARRVLAGMQNHWQREWDENGFVTAGADFAFCRRAQECGYLVWAHYDYPCEHYKEIGLIEAVTALGRVRSG